MIKKTLATIEAAGLAISVSLFLPRVAAGAAASDLIGPLNAGNTASPVSDPHSIGAIVEKVVTWLYEVFFILAVIFFLLAAYNFMLGGSDEKKIATAKNQLKYGVIAVMVALISTGVAAMVYNVLH